MLIEIVHYLIKLIDVITLKPVSYTHLCCTQSHSERTREVVQYHTRGGEQILYACQPCYYNNVSLSVLQELSNSKHQHTRARA